MKIQIIPCLKDNYAYLVSVPSGQNDTVHLLIDAPIFKAVDDFLEKKKLNLDFILNTHHHWDHTDGNLELKNKYKCKIYGSSDDQDQIPGIDFKLDKGENFQIANTIVQTISVPGHTSHHIVYYFKEARVLFSGDTLFSMGCGRLFEGTYIEMFDSLQKIKSLPDNTKIYCGHEYSEKNAQFALHVDPNNENLKARSQEVIRLRQNNQPTVPTTLAMEKEINPFLRAMSTDEFKRLRLLRDTY